MNLRELPPEWSVLLNGMADDALTREQEQQLARLLQTDIEFRREYARFCQLLTLLTWQSGAEPARGESVPSANSRTARQRGERSGRWTRIGGMSVAIATVLVAALLALRGPARFRGPAPESESVGTLAVVVGTVRIVRQGERIPMSPPEPGNVGWRLQSGDRVETGREGSARVVLADRTEIDIDPGTELSLASTNGVTIALDAGRVEARVAPQREGTALTFTTPQSEVRVLGTQLELLSTRGRTEVAVVEGRVRVTRKTDGRALEVGSAQFLSVAETGALSVVDLPRLADSWSESFGGGLPSGWTGRAIPTGVVADAQGCVGAVATSTPGGGVNELSSPLDENGMCAWHPDSVLRVTFRIQPPEWFHISLHARPYGEAASSHIYCCIKPDLWLTSPGQWRTVSIPLAEFHSMTYDLDDPGLGRIPTRIVFGGKGGSNGIEIDRVAIERQDLSSADGNVPGHEN